MSFEHLGVSALDYCPCRYGDSRLRFRGPKKRTDRPYFLFLGGTETYGKFLAEPFPDRVGKRLGCTAVNLGCVNGGVDAYVNDRTVMAMAAGARATVIQVMGAHNLTNQFYRVHSRRNDRFLGASAALRELYPDVDFTEIAFTRHLVRALRHRSPERFAMIEKALQRAWVERMIALATAIDGPVILLRLTHRLSDVTGDDPGCATEPLFSTGSMIEALRGHVDDIVEVEPGGSQRNHGGAGMIFSQLEALAARALPGTMAHAAAAKALEPVLKTYLN